MIVAATEVQDSSFLKGKPADAGRLREMRLGMAPYTLLLPTPSIAAPAMRSYHQARAALHAAGMWPSYQNKAKMQSASLHHACASLQLGPNLVCQKDCLQRERCLFKTHNGIDLLHLPAICLQLGRDA